MTINPETLNLSKLPWLPLEEKSSFPSQPAIYFCLDSNNVVQYIGRSVNPKARWSSHHRYRQLSQMKNIKVCYLFVDHADLLLEIETALIAWFKPHLNQVVSSICDKNRQKSKLINKVKSLVDAKGISVYQFRKDTGVAQTTAYELYNNPQHLPSIRVLERICDAYNIQPNDVIERVTWSKYQDANSVT